jgi:REP element-mobilizing transposase RayT
MPRRFFEPWYYHVYNRWFEKMIIFKSKFDFERYYKLVIKYNKLDKYKQIKILSYSFLPNHFHFIFSNPGVELSNFIWDIQNSYAKYFNTKYARKWQLFEWRFKAKLIQDQEYLERCLAYVNFNPLKHEIVKSIDDYERTSYHQLANKDKINQYRDLVLDELEI